MRDAHQHGGALDRAIARFGGHRADWLDLSTGIAPVAPPLPAIPPEAWTRLPEHDTEERLREAARRCYDAPPEASVVLAPGTQSLISLWPHLFEPGEAALVAPTYGEHERALLQAGHAVRRIAEPSELQPSTRLLVLVNPNNPDARRFARRDLLALAGDLSQRGGLLVVDEAFMDPDPRESLAADAGRPGVLVLRSFGKFYGLAGLRLGFALTGQLFAERLAARLGPWPVSGAAIAIATALMEDAGLVERQRASLVAQNGMLRDSLERAGLSIHGATPLFALARHGRAQALFEALARRHILTRPFADQPCWLRFGNVAGRGEAERLSGALQAALAGIGG